MMGSGKSTVGVALARRLSRPFVDTDVEIECAAGSSVAEIFEREGEAVFREREREAIAKWEGEPAVVALGGGAIAQPGAAKRLSRCGTIVYLRARPETLLARLGEAGTRPLLRGLDRQGRQRRIEAILRERRDAYATAAVTVDTDGLDPEQVAREIAGRLDARDVS